MNVQIEDGKYEYVLHPEGDSEILRYGEKWRDATGDKFTYCIAAELEQLRQRVASQDTIIAEQNRLNKERQEWALHTNEVIRELRQRVAELEEQVDLQIPKLAFKQHTEQIAASQLENKRLRSALEGAYDYVDGAVQDHYESYGDLLPDRLEYKLSVKVECDEALSTLTDTEALEKYVLERLGEPVATYIGHTDSKCSGEVAEHVSIPRNTPLYALKEKP